MGHDADFLVAFPGSSLFDGFAGVSFATDAIPHARAEAAFLQGQQNLVVFAEKK
jgi:hypothetical protein